MLEERLYKVFFGWGGIYLRKLGDKLELIQR